MHRVTATVLTLVLTFAVVGCDQAQSALDDARSTVEQAIETGQEVRARFAWCTAAARLAGAVAQRDAEAARTAADDLRDVAPESLQDDLATIIAAVEQAEAEGSTEPLRSDEVQAAASAVYDETVATCGLDGDEG